MVLQPNGARPWTAICRGAVIRGLNDAEIKRRNPSMIVSRVSRVNYGMIYDPKFEEGKHDPRDKRWNVQELCWDAHNQLRWYLRRVITPKPR